MYKSIIKTALLSLSFLFIWVNNSYSQGDACKPDCENSDWTYTNTVDIYLPACQGSVIVYYKYRFACETWYDYYIEKVLFPPGTKECLDNGYNGDLSLMLRDVCEQLIILNPANFPPLEEGCEPNWRVLKGSCWTPDIIPSVPKTKKESENTNILATGWDLIQPCTSNDCCLEYYEVCIVNGERVINQTGYLPPEDPDCLGGYGEECVPVCGSVYNR